MTGPEPESARQREREAKDLDDVAEVDGELAARPDLAATARAVARELRDEGSYLSQKGETKDADARR